MPLTFIQIYLAQKQHSKALRLSELLLEDLGKKNAGYYLIRVLTWQALAYHGLRQESQALASIKRALTLAAPGGYVRTFINNDPALIPLLHQARLGGVMPNYVDRLLAAFEQTIQHQPIQVAITSHLVEPISAREMDVLKLLAQGCTDKKIAETLVIARETVHKHLKNIYGKLDVHSRTEAIVRAHELNLF
jgi:LuxR family maltose regulon positive regulatory protein